MTAETDLPEIPTEERIQPAGMRILRTETAQQIAKQIDQEVSTKPDEPVTPKRPPGRPPGSRNKNPNPKPATPPPAPKKTETERTADAAKDRAATKKDTPNPPDFTEWKDFLGEVVLHWFSVAFIAVAFRGIPYHEMMSQEDWEDIQLDDSELAAVARPFAHLITHSKINTKYGRVIMNSRDSIEASVVMFMWGSRVTRISRKYKMVYRQYLEAQENVRPIARVDRATDTAEQITAESPEPVIGIQRAAFGHGFN
jgi:hypothetical protein